MAIELKGFFNQAQASQMLGVHRITVQRWLKAGTITAVIIAGDKFIQESEIDRVKQLIAEGKLKPFAASISKENNESAT